jgi:transcriptional/translational regulatory protein YebC/TACO1
MGESGCVAWIFDKRGYILVDKRKAGEEKLMAVALDAGAIDMKNEPGEDSYEIITEPENLSEAQAALEASNIPVALAEVTMLPKNYVELDAKTAEQMARLMEALEDHDDVQNVYANFDIPEEVAKEVES